MAPAKKQPTTLKEWGEQYLEYCKYVRHMSPVTVSGKTYMLNGFIRQMYSVGVQTPGQLTNIIVDNWISWLDRDCKNNNNSINTKVATVKVFLEYIRDMDGDIHLKFVLITRRKAAPIFRKEFSRAEINRALSLADRQEWLMIKLCFDCALRIGELQKLEVAKIDLAQKKIYFIGKGQKPATVYITEEVKIRLEDWIQRTKPKKYLWEGEASLQGVHRPMSISQIRKRMKRRFEQAGLQGFHPHALRYSCATEASDLGAPTHAVQRLLRHSNVGIVERYLCNKDRQTQKAFVAFRQNVPDDDLR